MKLLIIVMTLSAVAPLLAATITVDVNVMPRVVFTGDSQTCGRVGAMDYPQMLSREMPIRVINTGVGGTNTRHLLREMSGGTASVKKGEKVIKGTKVTWHAGPYPGQKITLGAHKYVIDRIEVVNYKDQRVNLWITEPAMEDFEGADYKIEAGWRVRIAEQKPHYACFMYSVNDTGLTSEEFRDNLAEIVRRTRALGAQPIFLSGAPLMTPEKGATHPGTNARVAVRANEMKAFCAEQKIPFGDVFHTLMLLDEPLTCVWVDTVHPTTDGSTAIVNALRSILRDLGLAQNPYYVRGYKALHGLCAPDGDLQPFTTSQPDYTAQNVPNENLFDLAAIKTRDEYGLIAAANGDAVESETPIILQFGVGKARAIKTQIVVSSEASLFWFDWQERAWRNFAHGNGSIEAALPAEAIAKAIRNGAVWLAITGPGKLALDYAAVMIEGARPYTPQAKAGPIIWPQPDEFAWHEDGNLIKNGALAEANGEVPTHWQKYGEHAHYIRSGIVASGVGGFTGEKALDRFKSPGQRFTTTVRPLDMLHILAAPDEVAGLYLVGQVIDDETLKVRRSPKAPVGNLKFEVTRTSGCGAVPGGCLVQCCGESYWESTPIRLRAGPYRLGFFYRAYDPQNMNAKSRPARTAKVIVRLSSAETITVVENLEVSYQWQRAWKEVMIPHDGDVQIRLTATSNTPIEYTGVSLTAQK